ncbi:MAG: amidohydrolase family protein [Thermovirgaceae bacterium]|nr:amidohydrolase family protein [Thermovirgaceae bacterium]
MVIHAIGDLALDHAIRAIAAANDEGPSPCALPHRINHAMICRPEQLEAMKKLGVVLDIQPAFVPGEIDMATVRLGEERISWSYPWKSFVDSGLVVTGSSDCPVEPPTPWRGIWGAMCRVGDDGKPEGGWQPRQKLTLDEALELWTANGALAVGEGGRRGRIAPGFLADLAVLDRDIFKTDPMDIKDVEALLALAGGKVTHGELLPGWEQL